MGAAAYYFGVAAISFLFILNGYLRGSRKRELEAGLGFVLLGLLVGTFFLYGWFVGLVSFVGWWVVLTPILKGVASRVACRMLGRGTWYE